MDFPFVALACFISVLLWFLMAGCCSYSCQYFRLYYEWEPCNTHCLLPLQAEISIKLLNDPSPYHRVFFFQLRIVLRFGNSHILDKFVWLEKKMLKILVVSHPSTLESSPRFLLDYSLDGARVSSTGCLERNERQSDTIVRSVTPEYHIANAVLFFFFFLVHILSCIISHQPAFSHSFLTMFPTLIFLITF